MTESTFTQVAYDPFAGGELVLTAPATEAQKEIWLSVQMGPEANCAYNESSTLRLRGLLDVEALREAIQQLIQRHEALRTTFSPDGSTLCVLDSLTIDVPLIDLSGFTEPERAARLAEILEQEVGQPFNLEWGPLVRAQIVKVCLDEHQVVLTFHHIVCDGWSWGVLVPDLGKLYTALRQGLGANLPEAEQFSQYALLQAERMSDADERYWLDQFADRVPLFELPADLSRPPLRTFTSGRIDRQIAPGLAANLKRVGAQAGCSLLNVLLAGYEAFLYRLTGQEELVIGLSAAGQAVTGMYHLVGHCVNMLPLRAHVEGQQPFRAYLKARRAALLDAYDHQQFTFGSLVSKLRIPRDPSRIPLMPVTFNLEQALGSEALCFDGLEAKLYSNPRRFENFEIFVNVVQEGDRLTLECQYNTDLYRAETIRRRLAEFECLLAGIVDNPEQPIYRLPILPGDERLKLTSEWNDTGAGFPTDLCLHHLFENQVERTPKSIAVRFEGRSLSYEELEGRANQLAHHLRRLGVQPDMLVGVYMERSPEMVVALLGILKAGGAYVPVDPEYPRDRVAFMLTDAQATVLLTQQHLLPTVAATDTLPELDAAVVALDAQWDDIAGEPVDRPASGVTVDHLAYVIYTSGSTGKPKGAMIPHRAIVNHMLWLATTFAFDDTDRVAQKTPFSFDASVHEFFAPLMVGGQLVVASPGGHKDPAYLARLIQECQVTVLFVVPSLLRVLVEEREFENCTSLRCVFCGGEVLSAELQRRFFARSGTGARSKAGARPGLVNLYGPTECAIDATYWVCQSEYDHHADLVDVDQVGVPIGRPVANTQAYVLDRHLQPLPIGVPGELHIGGVQVARGYLYRPELTAERFIAHPFSDDPQARLYKTGDLVRYLPDGNLEFLGRIDHQVKLRGFRIELGEVEAVLAQCPALKEAAVILREGLSGVQTMVAYVVPGRPGPDGTDALPPGELASELDRFLRATLPDYMVPTRFCVLDHLPLTGNGKVDRKALPAPELDRATGYVAPRTPLEQQLATIWAEVLHLEQVGVRDSFFELGGHSLLAIRLFARIEEQLTGQKLPLAMLLQAPTVEQLADVLRDEGWSSSWSSLVPIQPGGSRPPFFFVHAHDGIVVGYHDLARLLGPDQPFYALQAQGLDGQDPGFRSLQEMTIHYVREMRTVQPQGPYYLGGWCFGGTLAVEMARQLLEQGQEVASLILVESSHRDYPQYRPGVSGVWRRLHQIADLVDKEVCNWLEVDARLRWSHLIRRIDRARMLLQVKLERALDILLARWNICLGHSWVYRLERLGEIHTRLFEQFEVRTYPGSMTLFRAEKQPSGIYDDPTLGWGPLIEGELEVHELPGHPVGLLSEPRVLVTASRIKAVLEKAQQRVAH